MRTIIIVLAIILVLFSDNLFGQNKIVNSGWFGAIKDIVISNENKYISVTGENYIHLFDSNKLNQIAIVKNVTGPKKSLFYSEDVLIILNNDNTLKYNIKKNTTEILTSNVYQSGYVDYLNNQVYLVGEKKLDTYQDLKLKKTLTLENNCKSIISTDKYLILGFQNGSVSLYDKTDYSIVRSLKGHKTAVNDLSLNDSNNILLSGASRDYKKGEFGESILWNIETGNILFRTNDNHKDVKSVHLAEDRMYISSLKNISIYNLDGELKKSISTRPYSNPIFAINKDKMIYGIADIGQTSNNLHEIKLNSDFKERKFSHESRQVWDINIHENYLIVTKDNEISILTSDGQTVTYPVFSHGEEIIYKGKGQIIGINIKKSELPENLLYIDTGNSKPVYISIPSDIISERFSSDFISFKRKTYSLTNNNLRNISSNKILLDFNIPISNNSSLFSKINSDDFFNVKSPIRKFIRNNSELMFYEYDRGNLVLNIRNAKNGKYLKQIKNVKKVFYQQENFLNILDSHTNSISTIDLTKLVVNSREKINNASNIHKIKYSSNRKLVAVKYGEYGNEISIINLKTNQNIPIRSKSKHVDCFEFSPNNKYLLTGNRYGEIEIWKAANGEYIGLIFTGSLKNEYLIISGKNFDGTTNGISNFLNSNTLTLSTRRKGLLKSLLFEE